MQKHFSIEELHMNWEQFVREGDEPSNVKKEIVDSWKRCRTIGINPFDKPPQINQDKLKRIIEKNQDLIQIFTPMIELTHQLIQGTGFIVVLTDKDGFVLEIKGDKQVVEEAKRNNFDVCANRSERTVGTNAIAMAIIEDRPIQIVGPEHYNINNHNWTCSAAPIHNPSGNVIGVLDLSGHYSLIHKHTLGMVASLVQAIEREFHVREKNRKLQLANEHLKAVIDSMTEGVIAIDTNGKVTAANSNLLKLLQIKKSEICGNNISDIFTGYNPLLEVFKLGQDYTDREETFTVDSYKVACITTARQIKNENNFTVGVVGVLREKKEIHRMINRFTGAKASFTFSDIIGKSQLIKQALNIARIVAEKDTKVLLEGESGTGKELFAQSIHNASRRSCGPFIAVNCGAIPRELIESELFGYSDGAFTGAKKGGKPGKFELAEGGTLFLDEVSSMPLEMQVKLLRVLQQNEVTRVGGVETIPIDVRVITASNEPLEKLVNEGHFRNDLYYRLGVVIINIPPLRERTDDISTLFVQLLHKICGRIGKNVNDYEEHIISWLCSYDWPGNVRELENYIERAVIIAEGGTLGVEHFPPKLFRSISKIPAIGQTSLAYLEKDAIEKALLMFRGNITKASKSLGITRNTLYNKIKDYNLSSISERDAKNLNNYN